MMKEIFPRKNALINCDSKDEFVDRLQAFKSTWDKNFFQYFQAKTSLYVSGAIRNCRRSAGLEDHEIFYTNGNESLNKIIKKRKRDGRQQ